jgi:hypothetical protein
VRRQVEYMEGGREKEGGGPKQSLRVLSDSEAGRRLRGMNGEHILSLSYTLSGTLPRVSQTVFSYSPSSCSLIQQLGSVAIGDSK